jgi:hypothetical protein
MDNENLITETETNRLKFIQQFAETSRGTESLNEQVNMVQYTIQLLKNELAQA